jgi:DNA polymerase-1
MAHLLVDTYSLLFRAFHALPPMSTSTGEPTGALYGFCSLLVKLVREEKPEGVALALDAPQATFRHDAYADYKGQRAAIASDLSRQLARLPALIEAFGFPAFRVPGFEADDVLATLSRRLSARGERVLVASGDRDMLQLVRDDTHVLFLGQRGKPPVRYDPRAVAARFGVSAQQLPEYVALVGDPSDNIPKVKGVGPETARKLISTYGSIDALLASLAEVESARLRDQLTESSEQLRRSVTLLHLRDDVTLPEGPLTQRLDEPHIAHLRVLFAELEFQSLLPRLDVLARQL